MNNTTKRAYVLYVVLIAFMVGLGAMLYAFFAHGSEWTSNVVNRHIYTNGQIASAGAIYDKNGTALVQSKDGVRIYNSDASIRKATLHAVGDNSSFIATGVQYVYSSSLSGYDFVNGVYNLKKYNKGNDINLTLDADVCKTAYKAMNGRKGTIAVYNYKTGEIVCMVSTPTYDPQNKPKDIDSNSDYEGVYMNRFLSGLYTPGSTFKIVTAICAIENIPDIYKKTFTCTGEYKTGDGTVICNGVHGKVNFEQALNHSCNSAFAQIAIELGQSKLMTTAGELGFNTTEKMGEINLSKSRFDVSTTSSKADLGWAGIGQYTTLVNPCHMLTIVGGIANGGTAIKPYFVKSIVSPSGKETVLGKTEQSKTVNITSDVASQMKKLLRSNVVNYYSDSTFPGLQMCGKTGTAEIDNGESHSWFVGFSQNEKTPYAVVCVVENSGSGLQAAGPVVNTVMQKICK
jgi:peptidoglycan glycosyltransferase